MAQNDDCFQNACRLNRKYFHSVALLVESEGADAHTNKQIYLQGDSCKN